MWIILSNLFIAALALITVLALFFITPFALHREMGFGGLVLGISSIVLMIIEGGPGPITQFIAGLAVLLVVAYLIYDWYVTSPLFI